MEEGVVQLMMAVTMSSVITLITINHAQLPALSWTRCTSKFLVSFFSQ